MLNVTYYLVKGNVPGSRKSLVTVKAAIKNLNNSLEERRKQE